MGRARVAGAVRVVVATLAVLLLLRPLAPAQDVTEPALKAAYIFNFILFTTWPADLLPSGAPIVICVVGDPAVGDAVQRGLKGRDLAGHELILARATLSAPLPRPCHVVYVSGMTVGQAGLAISSVKDTPVLTVSDIDGFASAGGIAQFYFEHGQLRFIVNLAALKRSRLQISSRVLALAKPL